MNKNVMVIDTETAPLHPLRDGSVNAKDALVYDVGYLIFPKRGGLHVQADALATGSFVCEDTFFNKRLMRSAYYADKRPQYYEGLSTKWHVRSIGAIREHVLADMAMYHVSEVWAYNSKFDREALNHTATYYSNDMLSSFLPSNTKWYDLWAAAETITSTQDYVRWACEMGHVTAKGNVQTSVEVLVRYLTGQQDFSEDHTALSDATHEATILRKLYGTSHRGRPKKEGQGWRAAARTKKHMIEKGILAA